MATPRNPARGNELPHAKLSREKVAAIRARYEMGVTQRRLAECYGVHVNTIHRVVNYQNWWHA